MAAGVVQPLNPLIWLGAPTIVCVLAAVVLSAPVTIAGVGLPQPALGMICAFAWAMIRPSVLAPFALLALGLFDDLLWGDRLGLWPAAFLTAHAVTLAARPVIAGLGFAALWGWYLAACASGFAAAVALTLVTAGRFPDLWALAIQLLATGAIFWFAWKLIETYEDADVRFK
jgi:rod shape-determining protein MreD